MTFIALLQFLFIDEGIYLKGKIDISQMMRSGDALFGSFLNRFQMPKTMRLFQSVFQG